VPAITEAGGTFARYFDPNNASSAYALIRATIDDPQDLQTWSEEIARSYAPVPWVATAEALVAALDRVLIHP
jgi:hypothetical protein